MSPRSETPGGSPATPELIAFAKSKGLSFTPTLANMESSFRYYENPALLKDPLIADLLLLDADPTADIANLRRIHRVMRAGKWVE